MANKVYAVRKGFRTGKFYDWDVVKGLVIGYSGAEYKSFSGKSAEEEADAYLGINTMVSSEIKFKEVDIVSPEFKSFEPYNNPYKCDNDSCIAFVDGSYDKKTKRYSFGAVVFTKDEKYCLCGFDDNPYLSKMHNISGELLGAINAIKKAESLGMKRIMIIHDLEGTAGWAGYNCKMWNANEWGTSMYQRFIVKHKRIIDIAFKWVKGHSGVTHNEEADRLAASAIKNNIRCDSMTIFKDLDS